MTSASAAPAGQGSGSITIQVNGQAVDVKSAPDTPLLYVLRDEMGLHAADWHSAAPVRSTSAIWRCGPVACRSALSQNR